MAHTCTRMLTHMVFATHERRPIIVPEFKPELHSYMVGIARNLDCYVYALNGVEDHCHLIFDLSPKIALADFANKLKTGSSKWARRQGGQPDFSWQRGYGAFSMNQESLERAIRYVENQEEHHRKQSLPEELDSFVRVNGLKADPEFVTGVYNGGAQ
jgi:putative transposase